MKQILEEQRLKEEGYSHEESMKLMTSQAATSKKKKKISARFAEQVQKDERAQTEKENAKMQKQVAEELNS